MNYKKIIETSQKIMSLNNTQNLLYRLLGAYRSDIGIHGADLLYNEIDKINKEIKSLEGTLRKLCE
jgi:hypothetical protein